MDNYLDGRYVIERLLDLMGPQLGIRICYARSKQGLTQLEVADTIGIRIEMYEKLENGRHAIAHDKMIILSELLKTSAEYLITGSEI